MSSYNLKKNINTYNGIEISDNIELSSDGYKDKVIHRVDNVTKLKSSVFDSGTDGLLLLVSGLYIIGYIGSLTLISLGTNLQILLSVLLVVFVLFIVVTIIYGRLYGMIVIKTGNDSIVIKDDKEKINNIYEDIVSIY